MQSTNSSADPSKSCGGELCCGCTKDPADSHDGCHLWAARCNIECLESEVSRAHETSRNANTRYAELEKEMERVKQSNAWLVRELCHADDVCFGKPVAHRVTDEVVYRAMAVELGGTWTPEKIAISVSRGELALVKDKVYKMLVAALCAYGYKRV